MKHNQNFTESSTNAYQSLTVAPTMVAIAVFELDRKDEIAGPIFMTGYT